MTICIAANFEDFVVFVADTRTTYGRPAVSYVDGKQKIKETPVGLIVGSGWVELLDTVIARVCESTIKSPMEIKQIVVNEISLVEDSGLSSVAEYIESTGWLYSYETIVGGSPVIRLGFHHGSNIDELRDTYALIPPGSGCVWIDAQYSDDASIEYSRYLISQLEEFDPSLRAEEKIEEFFKIATELVEHTSACYDSISPEFTLGFHHFGSEFQIFEPISVLAQYNQEIAESIDLLEERKR